MLERFRFRRKPYRVGLALSGGGARGFAHAGALAALEELGIRPDIIAGVSAGSVVTGLYAGGMRPKEILEAFSEESFTSLAQIAVPKDGFFRIDGFKRFLREHIPYERIEQLPIPSLICATDLDKSRGVAFREGDLVECIAASCSIPIIFKPVRIDGVTYVDGGVVANLPAWALREHCKYVIGINCSPLPKRGTPTSIIDIAQRTYDILVKTNSVAQMEMCDLAVSIDDIAKYQVFNLKEIERVYHSGYQATMKALLEAGFPVPRSRK
ncbi:MAG: patatin-like phospholipase family protein [Duncaniella sp.]|nr:patatin-like phospholipase family protein [Duncaniella sp.]